MLAIALLTKAKEILHKSLEKAKGILHKSLPLLLHCLTRMISFTAQQLWALLPLGKSIPSFTNVIVKRDPDALPSPSALPSDLSFIVQIALRF